MSRATIGGLRAEIAALHARATQAEQERAQAVALLQWYSESRRRWMDTVEHGSGHIYRQTGGRLTGPDEELPAPIGCIYRPEFREQELLRQRREFEGELDRTDFDVVIDDISSW